MFHLTFHLTFVKMPTFLFIALAFAIFGHISAAPSPNNTNFTHIGTFKTKAIGILAEDIDEFNYFVSNVATDWATARADCGAQLNGDLLSFNTKDEADWISEQLDGYGSAVNYWTAGQVISQDFTFWATDGSLLPIWLNWSPNNPPANSNPLLRVKLYHINKFYNFYEVDSNTKPLRYICKRS